MIVIDAKESVLGRVASKTAKLALGGEKVEIVNAEKALIFGDPKVTAKKYKTRIDLTVKGNPGYAPKFPRTPDRIVRRAVRGMLPFRTQKGRDAFRRVMCHVGVPEKLKSEKAVELEDARKSRGKKFVSIGDLSTMLGAKW